jgi:hypothetical protein
MGGECSKTVEVKNAYEILVGKFEGESSVRGPRRRWKDNIKIYLKEIIWKGVD